MSDLSPALTEDMVEKAAHSLAAGDGYDWDDVSQHWQRIYRDRAEDALSAALAGRVVVDLPEPDWSDVQYRGTGGTVMWGSIVTGPMVLAHLSTKDGEPTVVGLDGVERSPEYAERNAARLLAAAREARRLAAEGGEPQ